MKKFCNNITFNLTKRTHALEANHSSIDVRNCIFNNISKDITSSGSYRGIYAFRCAVFILNNVFNTWYIPAHLQHCHGNLHRDNVFNNCNNITIYSVSTSLNLENYNDISSVYGDGDYDQTNMLGSSETESVYRGNKYLSSNNKGEFIVISDDSGLEVDCLNGAPGVYSARYADDEGYDHDDIANVNKLLRVMHDVPESGRTARFVCAIAVKVVKDGRTYDIEALGYLEGRIARVPAGEGGFGYDPVLYIPEYHMTVAQMSAELKNEISHRGRALVNAVEKLKEII